MIMMDSDAPFPLANLPVLDMDDLTGACYPSKSNTTLSSSRSGLRGPSWFSSSSKTTPNTPTTAVSRTQSSSPTSTTSSNTSSKQAGNKKKPNNSDVLVPTSLPAADRTDWHSQLVRAAVRGDLLEVQQFVQGQPLAIRRQLNARDPDGWTVLTAACWYGRTRVVLFLLRATTSIARSEINAPNPSDNNNSSSSSSDELVEKNNSNNNNQSSSLHTVSTGSSTSLSSQSSSSSGSGNNSPPPLLHNNPSKTENFSPSATSAFTQPPSPNTVVDVPSLLPPTPPQQQPQPQQPQSQSPQVPLVDVNGRDAIGWTALHGACWKNHPDIVRYLLLHQAGLEVNAVTDAGNTALQLACRAGHTAIVQLLAQHASAVVNWNAVNTNGQTALHEAVQNQHAAIVECLVQHAAKQAQQQQPPRPTITITTTSTTNGLNVNVQDSQGDTALHLASRSAHKSTDLVRKLLASNRINVALVNQAGKTAADVASCREIKQILLDHADPYRNSQQNIQDLFVQHAGEGNLGQLKRVEFMPGVTVNGHNRHGHTALTTACWKQQLDVAMYLIHHPRINVNLGHAHETGWTPLQILCRQNWEPVLETLLVQRGHELNINDAPAVVHNNTKTNIKKKKQPEDSESDSDDDDSSSSSSSEEEEEDDVDGGLVASWGALHFACAEGHLGAVQCLATHAGDDTLDWNLGGLPHAGDRSSCGPHETPLHVAVGCGHAPVVEFLLQQPAVHVNAPWIPQPGHLSTALHQASAMGRWDIVNLLMHHPDTWMELVDQEGRAAWEVAQTEELGNYIYCSHLVEELNHALEHEDEDDEEDEEPSSERIVIDRALRIVSSWLSSKAIQVSA